MGDPMVLMVVGAHAGDAENMAGAIAAKYGHSGNSVLLVHMTLGERGHPKLSDEDYAKQKKEEAESVAKILGATPIFLPYKDGELPNTEETRYRLCDVIRKHRPHIILTHWKGSLHRDHRHTHYIVRDSVFYSGLKGISRSYPAHRVQALYFAENWEDSVGFKPEILVDVSDFFDVWREAVSRYAFVRGETGFNYLEYYTCLMRIHGLMSGKRYAEALMRSEHSSPILSDTIPLRARFATE